MSDEKLRALLERAHAGDATPAFRRMLAPRAKRPGRLAWVAAVAAVAGAVALAWWRVPEPRPRASSAEARPMAQWRAPTDFLLETPGRALLRGTPRISLEVPDYTKGMPL